ncbi:F-box protein [Phanerochaete sordida]|uniref:F-box protein n=1 Tax=Phanerochaete sordida TaxID=48140 RepID=A0A9P3GPS0_9APHY|nr:F-box protein [Phanerochaete sordida]
MDPCPSLPAELHDHIIDFLFDDKPTLSSCSHVCRSWRVTSQYHLFHTLRVKHPVPLETFTDFLGSAPPHIAAAVRDLALSGAGTGKDITYDAQMLVTTHSVAACMAQLPGLRALSLEGVWWSDATRLKANDTPRALPAHPARALAKLSMCKVFTTPAVLFDTVCSFSAIGTLHVESVFWTFGVDRSDPTPALAPNRPTLQHLVVGPGSTYNMLRCFLPILQERVDVAALQSLSLSFEHFDAWPELKDFLVCVSPHLSTLSLKFGKYVTVNESSQSQLRDLQLSSFAELRSFEVDLPADDAGAAPSRCTWALLQFLLPQLPPTVRALRVVHKSHLEALESRLAGVEWALVDALLAASATLRDVRIKSESASVVLSREAQSFYFFSPEDLWDYLEKHQARTNSFFKEKLPQLEARGILSLE